MNLSISDLMAMQKNLHQLHEHQWYPLEPEYGKQTVLFMVEEIGEVISIWKKKGERAIVDDPTVRQAFLEEMADVLMYYHEVLLRFHVTPEEISKAYQDKHDRNMTRNYQKQYEEMLHDGQE